MSASSESTPSVLSIGQCGEAGRGPPTGIRRGKAESPLESSWNRANQVQSNWIIDLIRPNPSSAALIQSCLIVWPRIMRSIKDDTAENRELLGAQF